MVTYNICIPISYQRRSVQPCGICGIQCVFGRRQDDIVADVAKVSAAALEKKARRFGQFQGQNFRSFASC